MNKIESIDLGIFFHALIEKKWILIFISLMTFIFTMGYVIFKPIKYQANVLLEIHHKQESSLGSITDYAHHRSVDNLAEEPISLQIALIRSKFILEPVIKSLNLAAHQSVPEVIKQIRSHLTITDLSNLAENSAKKVGILQLTFTGDNPTKTIEIINKIALITQEKDKERKSFEAKKTLSFLYQQLPILQTSLKEAEAKLNQYRSTNGKINTKLQTEYLLNHLADINKQLHITHLKKTDMSQLFTPHHPFMIAINQKQNELQKEQYKVQNQIKQIPATNQVATNLERDVNVKSNLYVILLNRIHEQQVITAGIVSDISILSQATFSEKSFVFNLPLIACGSLTIGFMLGCMGILIWLMFKKRLPQPYWREQKLNIKDLINTL